MSLYKPVETMSLQEKVAALCYVRGTMTKHRLYAEQWLARINTGQYKLRMMSRGCERSEQHPDGWIPYTDEEKLDDALGIIGNHMRFLDECMSNENEILLSLSDSELQSIGRLL